MNNIHEIIRRSKSPGGASAKWLIFSLLIIVICGTAWQFSHREAKASEPDLSLLQKADAISSINGIYNQGIGSPLVIPAAAFNPDSSERDWSFGFNSAYIYPTGAGSYCGIAPLYLPDGSTVRSFGSYVLDDDATDSVTVYLYAKPLGSTTSSTTMASVASTGQSAALQLLVDDTITQAVVDNDTYTYHIGVCLAGLDNSLRFYAVKLSYSIPVYVPTLLNSPFTTLAFDSQFNGSSTGWINIAGTWYTGVNDFYTFGNEGLWSSAAYNTIFSNLDYQARMIRYGCDDCPNSLIIRGTYYPLDLTREWYNEYRFQYTRNGQYSIWKVVDGGDPVEIQPWVSSPAINQGDAYNILRVIADGSRFFYYINGVLVWSGVDTSLTSGMVGLAMYESSPQSTEDLLRVDWATLYTNHLHITDVVSPEQQSLNDSAKLNGGGDITHSP